MLWVALLRVVGSACPSLVWVMMLWVAVLQVVDCACPSIGGDPCFESYPGFLDTGNVCDDTTGSPRCTCVTPWLPVGTPATQCQAPATLCLNDPCTISHSGNACSSNGATLACTCDTANGWSVAPGGQSCLPPANPCDVNNAGYVACQASFNTNDCAPFNGSYQCRCDTSHGYLPTSAGTSCACINPCQQADPCNTKLDPQNICTWDFNPTTNPNSNCQDYHCTCGASQFRAINPSNSSNSSKYCIRKSLCDVGDICCQNPCANNPCSSTGNTNVCINTFVAGSTCASFTCACGTGWVSGPSNQSCVQCPNPCLHDLCLPSASNLNKCLPTLSSPLRGVCGSYQCSCGAPGYYPDSTTTPKSCQACPNVCSSVAVCSQNFNSGNRCLRIFTNASCGGFECDCAPGWMTDSSRKSCTVCPNPCQSDPCNKAANPSNLCIVTPPPGPGLCAGYSCACSNNWIIPDTRALSCNKCANPCSSSPSSPSSPCSTNINSANLCIQLPQTNGTSCGGYRCYCTTGWTAGPSMLSCIACPDPCASKPCGDQSNTCMAVPSTTACPSYRCNCASGWITSNSSSRSCTKCGDPCLGDPCTIAQTANTCTTGPQPDGLTCPGYRCTCGTGWLLGPASTCTRCGDPCVHDPCSTAVGSLNKCLPIPVSGSTCASYTCDCGPGWTIATNRGSCSPCRDACSTSQCSTDHNPLNICIPFYNFTAGDTCPRARCMCAAGWLLSLTLDQCTVCPSACTGDPCSSAFSTSNTCNPLQPVLGGRCGGYVCTCGGGWIPSSNGSSCIRCPDPCRADPCQLSSNKNNLCVTTPDPAGKTCPTYKCVCGAGWLAMNGGLVCAACSNPCAGDPCHITANTQNVCLSLSTGNNCPQRTCVCAPGWIPSSDASTCIQCTDPCSGDPCLNVQSAGNTCIRNATGLVTQCNKRSCICGPGWQPSTDKQTCIRCSDPCSSAPCGPTNRCVATVPVGAQLGQCGTFICLCGPGFLQGSLDQSCTNCTGVCGKAPTDACLVGGNPGNQCIVTSPATSSTCPGFQCVCGPGFYPDSTSSRCIACTPPCSSDPCDRTDNSLNTCTPTAPATGGCAGHVCSCAVGWQTNSASATCTRCVDPCDKDPCAVFSSATTGNKCVSGPCTTTYTCVCNAPGYVASTTGLACVAVMSAKTPAVSAAASAVASAAVSAAASAAASAAVSAAVFASPLMFSCPMLRAGVSYQFNFGKTCPQASFYALQGFSSKSNVKIDSSTGTITGVPNSSELLQAQYRQLTMRMTGMDNTGAVVCQQSCTLGVNKTESPTAICPSLSTLRQPAMAVLAVEGQSLRANLSSQLVNPSNLPLRFSVNGTTHIPYTGLVLDTSTGLISGLPSGTACGAQYQLSVSAAVATLSSSSSTCSPVQFLVSLNIACGVNQLLCSGLTPASAWLGVSFARNLTSSFFAQSFKFSPTPPKLSFAALGLPPGSGLVLTSAGYLVGTPTTADCLAANVSAASNGVRTLSVTVMVSDQQGALQCKGASTWPSSLNILQLALYCDQCGTPCDTDPCRVGDDPGNSCRTLTIPSSASTLCGGFQCKCGLGWALALDEHSCIRCQNPCIMAGGIDLCQTSTPFLPPGSNACMMGPVAPSICPTHTCSCKGPLYAPSPTGNACIEVSLCACGGVPSPIHVDANQLLVQDMKRFFCPFPDTIFTEFMPTPGSGLVVTGNGTIYGIASQIDCLSTPRVIRVYGRRTTGAGCMRSLQIYFQNCPSSTRAPEPCKTCPGSWLYINPPIINHNIVAIGDPVGTSSLSAPASIGRVTSSRRG